MSRASVSAAVLSIAVVAVLAAPMASAENCYSAGPCLVCCPDGYGGGCLYDILDDACFCACSPPAGGSSERPRPRYREYCYQDWYGREICDIEFEESVAVGGATLEVIPLEAALSRVSKLSGVQVTAPTLVSEYVRLSADRAGVAEMLDAIAEQVGMVPVVRGGRRGIELVPTADASTREISSATSDGPQPRISFTFESIDAIDALRMVAGAVDVDVAVPRGLPGRVSGTLSGVSWQEAVQAIADSSAGGTPAIRGGSRSSP
jgi:hypothetical protein